MYNTAEYMDKCVESLLEQDIPKDDYEIIFVDDYSSDNSLDMANRYKEYGLTLRETGGLYPLIKVCHHSENKGLACGRNTGLDVAEGDYLCFVDPDDYIEKNSLSELLNQMEKEHLDMLRFNYQKVDEQYCKVSDDVEEANFDYTQCLMTGEEFLVKRLGVRCYVWAYIYRTSFLRETSIRFVDGVYIDDTPWLPRVLLRAERVNCTPMRHLYYLQREGSMVHAKNQRAINRKVDGQMVLIEILLKQMQSVEPECQKWYGRVIAQNAISLLTTTSLVNLNMGKAYYNKLKKIGCFPLSSCRVTPKQRRKIMLINFCPFLFMLLVRLYNKV